MRAALYARYSSERQNERSVADQVAICERYAGERGWTVVRVFSDAAISGTTLANRPGLLDAMAAAERGEFDVLLAEDEDRFARDLEHQAHVFNRIESAGARLWTIATGRVELMHVAMKGFMAQDYIRNLSAKTKRGMSSNAEKGLATGSRLYGYRTAPGGAVEIVQDQAEVIRRIFEMFAKGATARDIAARLNSEGVPGPRGGLWNASSINGSRQRGNGVLQTELYAGVKVYGRMEVRKDRLTGKRTPRPIPPEHWMRVPVPHLRIVSEELWEAAASRKAVEGECHPRELANKRKPGIFTGMVKCGHCGASYTAYTGGRLICAGHRERGDAACSNRRTVARADVETTVLEGLRKRLLSPAAIKAYIEAWNAARRRRLADLVNQRRPMERRLGEIQRGIARIVDAIVEGSDNDAMREKMKALDAERVELLARIAEADAAPPPPVEILPASADGLVSRVEKLQSILAKASEADDVEKRVLIEAVRGLVDKIEVMPRSQERGGHIDIVLHGTLAPLIFHQTSPEGRGSMSLVVAGGGIEPPTCGL